MEQMYITCNDLGCKNAFSTRFNGVSSGHFSSLNLGFEYGDNQENVKKNWQLFSKAANISINNLVWGKQIHDNKVKIIDHSYKGKNNIQSFIGYDGFVTKENDITLTIFTADCAPLLLCDPKNKVIGNLHCGWKPLCKDIIAKGILSMQKLGADVSNIKCAIGPCIKECCFEVDHDVIDALENLLGDNAKYAYKQKLQNKFYVDLQGAINIRIKQLGLKENNIYKIDECSSCNTNKYFSYRKEKGQTGRMANIICL